MSFAPRGFERSRGAISSDIFVPRVRPPSKIRDPPQKVTNQTADKQPTPSDVSDDDGLPRVAHAGRFTLARFIRHTLLSVLRTGTVIVEVGIVPGVILRVSALLLRGYLGRVPMRNRR